MPMILNVAGPAKPQPAKGVHAALLAEISQVASSLLKFVEAERSGVCDGQGFWLGSDPILSKAWQLVALAKKRGTGGTSQG